MPCYDGGRDDYSNNSSNWEVKRLQERADLLARADKLAYTIGAVRQDQLRSIETELGLHG